ncbi:MAG TPA: hypothetical protein V6C84_26275 [Coleofasciculaceae cyanobacterium]
MPDSNYKSSQSNNNFEATAQHADGAVSAGSGGANGDNMNSPFGDGWIPPSDELSQPPLPKDVRKQNKIEPSKLSDIRLPTVHPPKESSHSVPPKRVNMKLADAAMHAQNPVTWLLSLPRLLIRKK